MCKKIQILVFFILSITASNAQQVALDFSRHKLYQALPNDLIIIAENIPCEALWVTSSQGSITGENCSYRLDALREGSLEINVYRINKNDTVHISRHSEHVYKDIPLEATIAGKTNGFISKNLLKRTPGVRANNSQSGFPCITYIVASYYVFVTREAELIYFEKVLGNRFSKDFRKICDSLQVGDEIHLCDVKLKGPTGKTIGNNILLEIR